MLWRKHMDICGRQWAKTLAPLYVLSLGVISPPWRLWCAQLPNRGNHDCFSKLKQKKKTKKKSILSMLLIFSPTYWWKNYVIKKQPKRDYFITKDKLLLIFKGWVRILTVPASFIWQHLCALGLGEIHDRRSPLHSPAGIHSDMVPRNAFWGGSLGKQLSILSLIYISY